MFPVFFPTICLVCMPSGNLLSANFTCTTNTPTPLSSASAIHRSHHYTSDFETMASSDQSTSTETSACSNKAKESTSTEIASIKAAFPNRCRVICDIGNYISVITVQPENLDVTIKFQLTAAYPTVVPEIAIRSSSLPEEAIADLRQMLACKACELIGQPMIQLLVKKAEENLHSMGLKPGKVRNLENNLDKKRNTKRKQKTKLKSEDEVVNEKLPPMKTADDVIKRIIWDDNLDRDLFIVGYVDRFKGLVEKYFSSFSWEDLATVDYDVLAIPRHRIQYFKYKNVKVWDKPRRIDNVFGSADGKKTIDVVIKEVEEMENSAAAKENSEATKRKSSDDSEEFGSDEDDYSDSDDEDDIEVTIGESANIGFSSASRANNDVVEEKADGDDPYWRNKLRPNYFLSIRITDEKILNEIGQIQDHLMRKEPLFAECCIPGASIHITLCTLGLDTSEQLVHAMETLQRIKPELVSYLPESKLKIAGVSHFYNRVIYAKVNFKKDFMKFCNHLKLLLREAGIQIRDGYDFVPHITIMKVNREVSRLRGSKTIPSELYTPFADTVFGEQSFDTVYLCSMGDQRREDGYYLTPLELHLRQDN